MYTQATSQAYTRRKSQRGQGRREDPVSSSRMQVRLIQLVVCVALFLAVYVGQGVFPERISQMGEEISALITSNTNFRAAFSALGESLSKEDSVLGDIGAFCVEVFGSSRTEPAVPVVAGDLAVQEAFLTGTPDTRTMVSHYLRLEEAAEDWFPPVPEEKQESIPESTQEIAAVPTEEEPTVIEPVGTVLEVISYAGVALPKNYTMDVLSLGQMEIVTPVFGPIHSTFGYRDHPLDGEYKFHTGVDIGGDTGDPILALADGTVDYFGENEGYGLYVKIDHGNGVKSFYAHCSAILVTDGQTVKVGEKIAEVGATGTATGPHLHLEITCGEEHINPIYYIEYKKSA